MPNSTEIEENDPLVQDDFSQLESVAEDKFGDRYGLDTNTDMSFTIVKSKYKNIQDLLPNIIFFVFDNEEGMIILTDTLMAGYVGWENEFTVKTIARITSENIENTLYKEIKFFDVKTREFISEP